MNELYSLAIRSIPGILTPLWSYLRKQKNIAPQRPIDIVADRLNRLLGEYSLSVTQLPRLVPAEWKWTIGDMSDASGVLAKLTGSRLEWLAEFFGVRPEWLEGTTEQYDEVTRAVAHDRIWLYNGLGRLPQILHDIKCTNGWPQMTVFGDNCHRNEPTDRTRFAVVISYYTYQSGDIRIRRHLVGGDTWSWSYRPSRLQLKALARWFWMTYHSDSPLVQVTPHCIDSIVRGEMLVESIIPHSSVGEFRFSDYGLSSNESKDAKDIAELNDVLRVFESSFGPATPNPCPVALPA